MSWLPLEMGLSAFLCALGVMVMVRSIHRGNFDLGVVGAVAFGAGVAVAFAALAPPLG